MSEPDWKARAATYKALLVDTAEVIETITASSPLALSTRTALDAQSEAIREITAD